MAQTADEQTNTDHAATASFRATMAQAPAAVSVVTTLVDGAPYGTTVSAFVSLSADPPTLLVSLANESTLLTKLDRGSVLGVNILSATQGAIASHFAQSHANKFAGIPWSLVDDAPSLPGRHAWITITATEFVKAADHTLIIGTVQTAAVATNRPLVYWRHTYGTHAAV